MILKHHFPIPPPIPYSLLHFFWLPPLSNQVFDGMDGEACDRYDAWPERLYIVLNGVVVYKGTTTRQP